MLFYITQSIIVCYKRDVEYNGGCRNSGVDSTVTPVGIRMAASMTVTCQAVSSLYAC